MTRRYNFYYEEEKYILKYNNPNSDEQPFEIDAHNMQFDTKKFYMYMFSDVKENITIIIENNMNITLDKDIVKKGERIYKVLSDLCKEITDKLNVECFGALILDTPVN